MRSLLGDVKNYNTLWYFEKKNVETDKVKDVLSKIFDGVHEVIYIYTATKDNHMSGYMKFFYSLSKTNVINVLDTYNFTVDEIRISNHSELVTYYKTQEALDNNTKLEFRDPVDRSRNKRTGVILDYGINHVFSMTYESMLQELYRLEKVYLSMQNIIKYMCLLPVPNQNHIQVYVIFNDPKHIDDIIEHFGETHSSYNIESELLAAEIIKKYFDFKDTNLEIFEYGKLDE